MVQVPFERSVAVEARFETVQIAGVFDVKLTGRLELAVAVRGSATEVLRIWTGIALNEIVCAARLTVKLCVITGAAEYTVLPVCVA
jgi:hypothetical protein